ncbi:hypothetical protein HD806DRAFT_215516 [Xylariaceae sp. AK1471]|nr:hypothetical protein HD806DRAFT_215516 [Xylariaceae sp. AK1471]
MSDGKTALSTFILYTGCCVVFLSGLRALHACTHVRMYVCIMYIDDIEGHRNRRSGGCQKVLIADGTHQCPLHSLITTTLGLSRMFLAHSSCLGVAQLEIYGSYNLEYHLMMPACEVSITTR